MGFTFREPLVIQQGTGVTVATCLCEASDARPVGAKTRIHSDSYVTFC